MSEPDRVVFDTNVFFQALISPGGPAGQCLAAVRRGELVLFVSQRVLAELQEVCLRPKLARRFRLTPELVATFNVELKGMASHMESPPHVFDYARDPDDAYYVDLAVAAGARLIVSRDNDLLALNDLSNPDGQAFQQRFPFLAILTPEELLARLAQQRAESS